jgi:hypothetical protein
MQTTRLALFVLAGIAAGCAPSDVSPLRGPGFPVSGASIDQPQLLETADGALLLAWNARGERGVDAWLSRFEDGGFQPPVRVNPTPGDVNRLPIDEMRPALAAGPGGRVALAWTDSEFDIQAGVSLDGGRTFSAPVRLNRDEGDALQEFPALAFDAAGRLHAVWLDPRVAGPGLEEPADLYYTSLDGNLDPGPELNLTEAQESSVCGCCLPDLDVEADQSLTITFRNTTDTGYRDPFRISGRDGQFGAPARVGPPVWRIDACPVAGPIGVGNRTLWLDGSTGKQRLLSAGDDPLRAAEVVLEDTDTDLLLLPPRLISGVAADSPLVLVPMAENSRIISPDLAGWRVVADDLPFWVTSAAVHDGQLLMVGTAEGFRFESRRFDPES